ncbi:MAG: AbrB/MazE/SpoVT family DNA-binding domain-containing protein [Geminicoccaceae bacterium]|nr:AbrB/MazE/SpoVT family DNA-binding domain-containing protein [Geminicoccaceae bacterium]
MTLVKLRKSAQLTLPTEIREALKLAEGDYLEAEIVQGGVLLRPVDVVRREAAWDDLVELVETPKWRTPPTESPEEEEALIFKMVEEARHSRD